MFLGIVIVVGAAAMQRSAMGVLEIFEIFDVVDVVVVLVADRGAEPRGRVLVADWRSA